MTHCFETPILYLLDPPKEELALPTAKTITEGDLLKLTYRTVANPATTFTWKKEGQSLPPGYVEVDSKLPATTIFDILQQSNISIATAKRERAGNYSVEACNKLGCVNSALQLIIQCEWLSLYYVNLPPNHQ